MRKLQRPPLKSGKANGKSNAENRKGKARKPKPAMKGGAVDRRKARKEAKAAGKKK